MKAALTHHAEQRCSERMGLAPLASQRQAQRAWEKGLPKSATKNALNHYLSTKENGDRISRIYGEHIYLFSLDGALITVLHLPHEYRAVVSKIKRRLNPHD